MTIYLMSKSIDDYISQNFAFLSSVAKGIMYRVNRQNLDPGTIITDAFMYLREKHHGQTDPDQIQRIVLTFIKNEIERPRSRSNYKSKTFIQFDDFSQFKNTPDEIDNDEFDFEGKQRAVDTYINNETDLIKRTVFRVYSDKGIRTCRDMGEHFGINYVSANKLINQLKNEICQIYKDQKG